MEKMENGGFSPLKGIFLLLAALISWLIIGPVLAISMLPVLEKLPDAIALYAAIHVPYIMLFLALIIGARLMGASLRMLLAGTHPFRWRYAIICGAAYAAFMALAAPIAGGIERSSVAFKDFLIFLIPVLLATPLQAISEEVLFRALPARITCGWRLPSTPLSALPLAIIGGLLFTLPHLGNAEVVASKGILPVLYYFLWGALAMALGIAADGFEAAAAMHVANNLFIALVVNYRGSSMPLMSLFISEQAGGIVSLIETIIIYGIIMIISLRCGCIADRDNRR